MGKRYTNLSGICSTGTLAKTGQPYSIVMQGKADIDAMLALQATVMNDLSAEEKSYLVPKDRAFFEKHFASDNIVLGVVVDGKLVAQAIIVNPTSKNPKTGMTDMPGNLPPEKVTVIQGVIVHPDYRGNRLMTEMVDAWLKIAQFEGRRHAIAEVSTTNHFSWSVFLKEGLHIHSIGYDPADAVYLYNMHANVKKLINARLKPAFNAVAPRGGKNMPCNVTNIEAQKTLIARGFNGVAFDRPNQRIIFAKPANNNPLTTVKKCITKIFRS